MECKGYDHPLYSLDLVPAGSEPPDEPRYALPVPGGRLMVRAPLRRRAAGLSTGAVWDAVDLCLSRHRLAVAGFSRFGLTAAWAGSLAHWRQRLLEQQRARLMAEAQERLLARELRAVVEAGQRLWGRLALASRMAGLRGHITAGRAPAGRAALAEALRQAAARTGEPRSAPLLARFGFGEAERRELLRLAARLAEDRGTPPSRQAQDALVVLRAALLGDVALLCQAAPQVLRPAQLPALQLRRLLAQRGA